MTKQHAFPVDSNSTLNIKLNCPIELKPASDRQIKVLLEIDERDEENFSVNQDGNTVFVSQEVMQDSSSGGVFGNIHIGDVVGSVISSGSSNVFQSSTFNMTGVNMSSGFGNTCTSNINGVRILSQDSKVEVTFTDSLKTVNVIRVDKMPSQISGNISMVGDIIVQTIDRNTITLLVPGKTRNVSVNGVPVPHSDSEPVDTASVDAPAPYIEPKVIIFVPPLTNIDATLEHNAYFAPDVALGNVGLTLNHGCVVERLDSKSLDVHAKHSCKVVAAVHGGALLVNVQNRSQVTASGSFTLAHVVASNKSQVQTSGTCSGLYSADAENKSQIAHTGSISSPRKRADANSLIMI